MLRTGWGLILCLLASPTLLLGQLIEGLVNIKFQLDARVFAVMAAINAAGFDLDAATLEGNPARKLVRERLAGLDPELRTRLREFYLVHGAEQEAVRQQSKYISFSLALKGPPEFHLATRAGELPEDARALAGFESLVKETWEKANLEALWKESQPYYLKEIEAYRPQIRRTLLACLRYMRTEPRIALDRQVVFIPDLLNAYGVVNAQNIGDNYFLLVGPSRSTPKSMHGVRHEYLHFMIDPLISKYAGYLPEPEPFLKLARRQPKARPSYESSFSLMITESLIGRIEQRMDGVSGDERLQRLVTDYEAGLLLAPYFDEKLEQFERAQEPLRELFPEWVRGIEWEQEKNRPEVMARVRDEVAARRAQAGADAEARANKDAEVARLLTRANELLLAEQFAAAGELLSQVLERDPENASALYGMAQLAGRRQDLESALSLYEKAAANAKEHVWIEAWSRVRRGNIYRFKGDSARARSEWSRALELTGDLRGAREAAQKALDDRSP